MSAKLLTLFVEPTKELSRLVNSVDKSIPDILSLFCKSFNFSLAVASSDMSFASLRFSASFLLASATSVIAFLIVAKSFASNSSFNFFN